MRWTVVLQSIGVPSSGVYFEGWSLSSVAKLLWPTERLGPFLEVSGHALLQPKAGIRNTCSDSVTPRPIAIWRPCTIMITCAGHSHAPKNFGPMLAIATALNIGLVAIQVFYGVVAKFLQKHYEQLHDQFDIAHPTVQIELADAGDCKLAPEHVV